MIELFFIFLFGLTIGALIVLTVKNKEIGTTRENLKEIETRLLVERDKFLEQEEFLKTANLTLRETFQALSAEALERNSSNVIELAKLQLEKFQEGAKSDLDLRHRSIAELVRPMKESLEKVDGKLGDVEKARLVDNTRMQEQLSLLMQSEQQLRQETSKLVTALRRPNVRGRWGEIQLRRVVEIAGMVNYCDFIEQEAMHGEGEKLRPDMRIKLPSEREIVIDSKVPLQAFLDALDLPDENMRALKLKSHADQVRQHIIQLSSKIYWERLERTPEFVVLFLPSEAFFSSALELDPELIEFAVKRRVIPATPTTLISLLQAVSIGWREEQLAKNAREIQEVGREFYEKADVLAKHVKKLGSALESAVRYYNDSVGSFETRFLTAARKFKDLGVPAGNDIEELEVIERTPRELRALAGPGTENETEDKPLPS